MSKSIRDLEKQVQLFCEEREWDQFHNPKDLAIGISTEANELLDLFRFKSNDEMIQLFADLEKKQKVEDEIADVLFFILRFAQMHQIDLVSALENKIEKNALKYPVEKAKGSNRKYNE